MPIIVVVIIRSIVAFFWLLVMVRLTGKQQMSELTFWDYVVGITIGSIAATTSVEVNQNTLSTLIGMSVWAGLAILLGYLTIHSVWIRKVAEGEATVVIENGRILEKNLARIRVSIDDLLAQLRTKDVFEIREVEFALFESNGDLSVLKKSQNQPLTPSDLNMPTGYAGLPTTLIEDGTVLMDALKSMKLSRAWLEHQLAIHGVHDYRNVSLAQLDTRGNLYVDMQGEDASKIIHTGE